MNNSYDFLNTILNTVSEHIAVIDENGYIKYVNKSWNTFGSSNDCDIDCNWIDVNYLEVCHKSATSGDNYGLEALKGIKAVINKEISKFYFEYPCHSPDEKRWFMMRVIPFSVSNNNFIIISHQNITERKVIENEVCELARIDGLTNIPNRRAFDEFLHKEYRRCMRLEEPITLLMIDIDHFKILNDTYGHQVGDNCLIEVAKLLENFANRADDLCARYGGEEFTIIWGNTTLEQAKPLAERLLQNINDLQIPNRNAPTKKHLTISIGIAEMTPPRNSTELVLIHRADEKLYQAKKNGRDRIEF